MLKNKKIYIYLRFILSAVILFLVFRMVDFHTLSTVLLSLRVSYVLPALLITLLSRVLVTYRWSLLLRVQDCQISISTLFKTLLVSHSLGAFIPSSLSSDVVKIFALWKHTGRTMGPISATTFDRFAGVFALTNIAFVSCLLRYRSFTGSYIPFMSGILFGVCILLMTVLLSRNWSDTRQCWRLEFLKHREWTSKLLNLVCSILSFSAHRHVLLKVVGLSFVVQILRIMLVFFLALTLGIKIPLIHLSMLVAIMLLLLMLPVSVGGIGVREAAYIYFFAPFGVSVEAAVGLSMLSYALTIMWITAGLIIYAKEGVGTQKNLSQPAEGT